MAFNIDEFKANMNTEKFSGLQESNKFLVQIFPPLFMQNDEYTTTKELTFFCDTTNLPGKSILTIDHKPQSYGDVVKIPVGKSLDNITLTFFCDTNFQIMKFFQSWLSQIVQNDSTISPLDRSVTNRGYREIGFMEDYARPLFIKGFSKNGAETVEYSMINAYPTQIGNVQTGWEQNDQILKIPVEFAYEYYDLFISGNSSTPYEKSPVSFFTRLSQLGTIAGVINTVRRPRNLQDLVNLFNTTNTVLNTL